jgi:hypothetical protein
VTGWATAPGSRAGCHSPDIQRLKPLDRHDHLRTEGRDIVDGDGNVVPLRGVNMGNWFVTEGRMCGLKDSGGRGAMEPIDAGFGAEKAATLVSAWQDHWFTLKGLDPRQAEPRESRYHQQDVE